MVDLTLPTADPPDPIPWIQTANLLPWWTPLAAALARRELTTAIRRNTEILRGAAGYEVIAMEAVWWSPTGEDREQLDRIARAALDVVVAQGIRIAPTAEVRTRRELTARIDARVVIRFELRTVSEQRPPLRPVHLGAPSAE